MLYTPFDTAWNIYLGARPRMPAFPPPTEPERVAGLLEVVDRGGVDLVLFDAYGVLHVGGDALPEGLSAFKGLRERRIPLCVVTNDVTRGPDGVCKGLNARGYDLEPEEIVSGRSLLPAIMDARPGGIWGVLATHDEDIAARFTDCVPMGHERAPTLTDLNSVDGFLFVDTNYWTDVTPSLLEAALTERPRPWWSAIPMWRVLTVTAFPPNPAFTHICWRRAGWQT